MDESPPKVIDEDRATCHDIISYVSCRFHIIRIKTVNAPTSRLGHYVEPSEKTEEIRCSLWRGRAMWGPRSLPFHRFQLERRALVLNFLLENWQGFERIVNCLAVL